eukprot:scaffold51834_cov51-Phaeocystis_antarctica.AAC.1
MQPSQSRGHGERTRVFPKRRASSLEVGEALLAETEGGGQGALRGDGGESEHGRPTVRQLCGLVLHLVTGQQAERVEAEVARLP